MACALLFDHAGARGGRYRRVPDRLLVDTAFRLSSAEWDELGVPVGIAFVFRNSRLGRWVTCYPSPGGATESQLPLPTWARVLQANPAMASVADDVEALLLRERGRSFECYLVPIDACYELVGRVRRCWRGLDGGQEVREEVDRFFTHLVRRARRPGEVDGR